MHQQEQKPDLISDKKTKVESEVSAPGINYAEMLHEQHKVFQRNLNPELAEGDPIQRLVKEEDEEKPIQGKGLAVNDNPALEQEADDMGKKAAEGQISERRNNIGNSSPGNSNLTQFKLESVRFSENVDLQKIDDGQLLLDEGSTGQVVVIVEQALADAGFLSSSEVNEDYTATTKNAVIVFQTSIGFTGNDIDGIVGPKTIGELDKYFKDYSVEGSLGKSTDSTDKLAGTRTLTDDDRNNIASVISTEVKADPITGNLPVFVEDIPGKGKYGDRVKAKTEQIIIAQYNAYGKDKADLRTDPDNLHSWNSIKNVAEESKNQTDVVFGNYKQNSALEPNVNIFDGWEDKEAKLNGNPGRQEAAINWRVQKIIQGKQAIKDIDIEHGAVQSRTEEKAILDAVQQELTADYRDELLETHKGWPGYASGGNVYLQRFKSSTDKKNRDYMWKNFRTIIHEYIHTLEHTDHIAYRNQMGEKEGNKTLREGVVDYFTKIVWNNINLNDTTLREKIEGDFHDASDPLGHNIPPMGAYSESENAERMAAIVGFRNVCAAFFLGNVELIGKK